MIEIKGRSPIFWGHEYPVEAMIPENGYKLPDQRWFTTSWMIEDQEPWRRSILAFRIKINYAHAIHFGLCRKGSPPIQRNLAQFSPSEIGGWGIRQEDEDDSDVQEEATSS